MAEELLTEGPLTGDGERRLYEAYAALRHNSCWQWLEAQLQQRQGYAARRLRQAADWPEYCGVRGELAALDSIFGLIQQLCAAFTERRDEDGDEFRPTAGRL